MVPHQGDARALLTEEKMSIWSEDKMRRRGDATSTTTLLLYELVRRRLDYTDCRGLGVWRGEASTTPAMLM